LHLAIVKIKSKIIFVKDRGDMMFKNVSKALLVSTLFGTIYLVYLIISYTKIDLGDDSESTFYLLLMTLVKPHLYLTIFGVFLSFLSVILKNHNLALLATFILLLAALSFVLYAIFLLPAIVMGFIGARNQKRITLGN
jgi:hypothetical protein